MRNILTSLWGGEVAYYDAATIRFKIILFLSSIGIGNFIFISTNVIGNLMCISTNVIGSLLFISTNGTSNLILFLTMLSVT